MDNIQLNLAILIILITFLSLIIFIILDKKKLFLIRKIEPLINFKKVFGFSIEQGKRMHICLGRAKIEQLPGASSIIALNVMKVFAQQSLLGDKPPIVSSGSGDLSILSQDIIKQSYRLNNAIDKFSLNRAYLTGTTPYSFIAGAMPILDQDVATQSLVGHFGAEVGILLDSGQRKNITNFSSSDSLMGQATMYAYSEEVLIGEELFAIPEQIETNVINRASLHTQDILRIIAIVGLILGAMLKMVGIL